MILVVFFFNISDFLLSFYLLSFHVVNHLTFLRSVFFMRDIFCQYTFNASLRSQFKSIVYVYFVYFLPIYTCIYGLESHMIN